jgi:hypothetical protein
MVPYIDRVRSASRDGREDGAEGNLIVKPIAVRTEDLRLLVTRLCTGLAGKQ